MGNEGPETASLGDARDLFDASERVGPNVDLRSIRASHLLADLVTRDMAPPYLVTTEMTGDVALEGQDCQILFSWIVSATSEDETATAWRVEVSVVLDLVVDVTAGLTRREIEAYARTGGVTTAYPYAREAVASLTARLNVPPFTMPLSAFELIHEPTGLVAFKDGLA